MYHYKARIYSPTLGRFLQTDPIGYADGMNWYNYVGGDPVNGRDPLGMCQQSQIDGQNTGECGADIKVTGQLMVVNYAALIHGGGGYGGTGSVGKGAAPQNQKGCNSPLFQRAIAS